MKFQSGKLATVIKNLEQEHFTGTIALTLDMDNRETVTKLLAFWQGGLTFAGNHLPTPVEFIEFLRQRLKLSISDSAIKIVEKRVKNKNSLRELLELTSNYGFIKWEGVESLIQRELILFFEPLLKLAGDLRLHTNASFDLSYGYDRHGFAWSPLQDTLAQRDNMWQSLLPLTPASIPTQGAPSVFAKAPAEVQEHLKAWVDGCQSLGEIAADLKQDPLKLAKTYDQWHQQHWIQFLDQTQQSISIWEEITPTQIHAQTPAQRPVVLSVDDSAIVQVSIQRAISDQYTVLCAKNALEALNILNSHTVELMLLDVTMPDIDGLELCRTIRNIAKFQDLPVVMLTAKDGLFDKVKGQFAGSTHYLTKPVNREKLLPVLAKYIAVNHVTV
jgi:CheY-like chemotaxis protein